MAGLYQFDSDAEAKRVLKQEGKRLKEIARKVWRKYLATHKPSVYAKHLKGSKGRTNRSINSIKLNPVFKVDANSWAIEVTFLNDLVYHESAIRSSEPKGHSIMLISSGWQVKRGKHKNIPRFGKYEGFDYIGQVVKEFNNGKHKGIELEVQWSGKYTK